MKKGSLLQARHTEPSSFPKLKLQQIFIGAFLFYTLLSSPFKLNFAKPNQLIILLATLFFFLTPLLASTKCNKDQCFTLTKTPNSYNVNISCRSSLPADILFSFLFDTSSVRKTNTYNDSIYFFMIDSNTYKIKTYFHYLAYRGYSVYKKSAFRKDDSISIVLEKFVHNFSALPKPVKASIYYKISNESTYRVITYIQNVTVDKNIGWIESKTLHWQFERFSKNLFSTIEELQKNSGNLKN